LSDDEEQQKDFRKETGGTSGWGDDTDPLPEYFQYRDEGCEFAPSCLGCPYEMCIYEEPGGRKRFARKMRDMEMMRLFSEEKKGVGEIALRFAVSERTVQRALKRSGNGG